MNENARLPTPKRHATTQAADGIPRLRWTLAEFEGLTELGFFGGIDSERERVELIDGEIIKMHAKGSRHEWVRGEISHHLTRQLPAGYRLYDEPGWRPGGDRYLEPEMLICRKGFQPSAVPPAEVLLLIEVADTSLAYDEGIKARIYAELGVREYWVVDARTLVTKVHREPGLGGYTSLEPVPATDTLRPSLIPSLSVALGSLGID